MKIMRAHRGFCLGLECGFRAPSLAWLLVPHRTWVGIWKAMKKVFSVSPGKPKQGKQGHRENTNDFCRGLSIWRISDSSCMYIHVKISWQIIDKTDHYDVNAYRFDWNSVISGQTIAVNLRLWTRAENRGRMISSLLILARLNCRLQV